jgi:hypothetical protein
MSLTCQAASLVIGDSTVCTATVTDDALGPPPQGTVEFFPHLGRNSFVPTTCNLVDNGNGAASCSTTYTPTGWNGSLVDRTLTARYGGEGPYKRSQAKFVIATVR